jgi:hypothetical protein
MCTHRRYALSRDPQQARWLHLSLMRRTSHTGVVSNLTNEGMKKLLEIPVPSGQSERTKTFVTELMKSAVRFNMATQRTATLVEADFAHWYDVKHCRNQHDRLYMRVFDGVTLMITKFPTREVQIELFKRLIEEMKDSVGMCYEVT